MPTNVEERVNTQARWDAGLWQRLGEFAKAHKMSKNRAMNNIIHNALLMHEVAGDCKCVHNPDK